MPFPDTLTNLRVYVDSKQNSQYVFSTSNIISSVPPLGNATLTGTTPADDANRPRLINDEIVFDDTLNDQVLDFGSLGDFSLGENNTNPDFILGFKFSLANVSNSEPIINDSGARNFAIKTNANGDWQFFVKGSSIKLSDNTTSLSNTISAPVVDTDIIGVIRGNLANNVGDVIWDGVEYNDVVLDGVNANGNTPFRIGFDSQSNFEYVVGAQSFGTLQQMRDLDSFLRGELDVLSHTVIVDGATKAGVKVAFFQMDAFAANNVASGAFENTIQLGTAVSDANGVATLDVSGIVAYDDTKAHFAQYADAFYRVSDSTWLLPQGFSNRNIDFTAPS